MIPFFTKAQEPRMRYRANKAVFLEVGGSGGITANFDYLTMETGNIKTSVRLGAGAYPYKINGVGKIMPVVPFELLGFIGEKAGNLELGVGYTHRFTNEPTQPDYHLTGRFGFRYQRPRGGLLFRLGYIPLLYKDPESVRRSYVLSPAFALSLGASF
ncbi:hypothetical protein [Adhaeribacter aerolatus]|uniref:hypothetical protein n=1 Tax=Adhaeribacter aerolatus TaxID=670289 RepID=UPI0011BE4DE7|nr:hypothetical protein [Adhaeribacter aerolatus]